MPDASFNYATFFFAPCAPLLAHSPFFDLGSAASCKLGHSHGQAHFLHFSHRNIGVPSSLPAMMLYPLLSFAVFLPLLSPPRRASPGLHASASTAEPASLPNMASGNRIVQPSSSSSSGSMRSKSARGRMLRYLFRGPAS